MTDMTGAVIPNATVRVDAVTGDATESTTTKNDGSYVLANLAPGFYKVRVDSKGFQSFSLTDVHVSSSALTQVDVKLQVGAAAETVTVSAEALTTQTMSASVVAIAPGVAGLRKKSTVTGPNGSATITEQTMTPRLRHVFEETAYWAPSLETTASGRTAFNFTLPDSLTTWKLHAVGSTLDGRLAEVDRTFKTFQPFFVDLDAPQVLTVGDEITLPVNLRNYTDARHHTSCNGKTSGLVYAFDPGQHACHNCIERIVSSAGRAARGLVNRCRSASDHRRQRHRWRCGRKDGQGSSRRRTTLRYNIGAPPR